MKSRDRSPFAILCLVSLALAACGGRGASPAAQRAVASQFAHALIAGRVAIAEALLERGAPVPAALVRAAPAPGAEIRKYREAARCYAANHGTDIRTLLASSPGGQRELAALRPLADDFFHCMPASAQDRRFNATHLRYMLAEALLRLPSATASVAQR
jgi:hypothetical protein